jgi:Amt family ammonium transporter
VHCIGGITGALMTGVLAAPKFGGQGIPDYASKPGTLVVSPDYDIAHQLFVQLQGVLVTLVWSGVISLILYFVIDKVFGLRVSPEVEHEGLDIAEHGERAYHY